MKDRWKYPYVKSAISNPFGFYLIVEHEGVTYHSIYNFDYKLGEYYTISDTSMNMDYIPDE